MKKSKKYFISYFFFFSSSNIESINSLSTSGSIGSLDLVLFVRLLHPNLKNSTISFLNGTNTAKNWGTLNEVFLGGSVKTLNGSLSSTGISVKLDGFFQIDCIEDSKSFSNRKFIQNPIAKTFMLALLIFQPLFRSLGTILTLLSFWKALRFYFLLLQIL